MIIHTPESKALVAAIGAGLKKEGEVKVTGLGMFRVKLLREHKGRNPKTGEVLTIKAHNKISFKVSKTLKDEVL